MKLFVDQPAGRRTSFALRCCVAIALFCCVSCSHMNPYENPERVAPRKDDLRRVLAPTDIGGPDYRELRYVSDMHTQLERVDEHRVRMHAIIAKIGSEREVYDAALWLAVPLVAFRPSQETLVRGAAVLGAGYGYLITRPKEQVPILQDTVGQLTCLMVAYSPYLYTTADFGELTPQRDYSKRRQELADAIDNFDRQTRLLLRAVPVKATTTNDQDVSCAELNTAECDARKKLRRKTTPGNEAEIESFLIYTRNQVNDADNDLRRLTGAEDEILRTAPQDVAKQLHFIVMSAGQRQEAVRRPPIAPDALAAGTAPITGPAAVPQSGERELPRYQTGLPLLRRLNKANAELLKLADDADMALSVKLRAAKNFMESHRARIANSDVISKRYCQKFGDSTLQSGLGRTAEPSSHETRLEDGR